MGDAVRDLADEATAWDRELTARFPQRLTRASRARGYRTVMDLARDARVSPESMRKYRSGERLPTGAVLLRLSWALDVPVDWLLGIGCRETAERTVSASRLEVDYERRFGAPGAGGDPRPDPRRKGM